MEKPQQINLIHLLPELDELLIDLLSQLSLDEWHKQTIAPQWKVKDVAVHLLDGNLRTLSMLRDQFYGETPEAINSYEDLVKFLNQLNADWVKATKRLSPKVIVDWLKVSGKEYCDFLQSLNPEEKAVLSVAWAGENESKNWFHIAREYTEKWHHQQQIRLAVGKEKVLLSDKWYFPYLDTSVRALPHHYRNTKGQKDDVIQFIFEGESQKNWFLHFTEKWNLLTATKEKPTTVVKIKDAYAWRVFTKGMTKEEAIEKSTITGDQKPGLKIFDMLAVMA